MNKALHADFEPEIGAAAAVVMFEDGRCVYEKNADEKRLIASTTKLMTALVAIELSAPEQPVEIPAACCGIEGSSMYLKPGQTLTADELIAGMLLCSGNDAAEALAVGLCGSEERFVAQMNEKAAVLGLNDTAFANPHGLDAEGHFSTARDLARLMLICMRNERFARLISLPAATIDEKYYVNHNKLLGRCEGCLGGKTGYTRAAGRCLVSCCEREGTRFVCVTLSDPDDWNDHLRLYDAVFAAWKNTLVVSTEERYEIPVAGGVRETAIAAPEREVRLFLPRGEEPETVRELPRFTYAPVREGACAGRIIVLYGGEAAAEVKLIYLRGVDRRAGGNGIDMEERLQKIIAASGLASRRAAEELIAAGRVRVNGAVAMLGDRADASRDRIAVDGKSLAPPEEKVYIMLNKPRGYVTTLSDEKGRRTVSELVGELGVRLYPVGRLDMNSEGLLIMTNDGELANRLMHPRGGAEKCYRTSVTGENIPASAEKLREPMLIDGYRTRGARVEIERLTDTGGVLLITIGEGRNRQVRKMCEQVGLRVTRLVRIAEGGLTLGELRTGRWRELTRAEIARLRGTEQGHENG
ncbi:MAG: pseudouridine synthase [Oscillospiraceae bacterium]|nr:pseudouridine synthase [Oscillospiraceae bacterium]